MESAFKNLIYAITVNNVANFIEMITNDTLFIPFVSFCMHEQFVFVFVRWTWRVLIKIKING